MIRNARFAEAGATPGSATGWVLRSICQAHAIAPFGPASAEPAETFERWSPWQVAFGEGDLAFALFGTGVVERFAWPLAEPWLALSGGIVAGVLRDAFTWQAAPFAAAWDEVASMGAAFAGAAREGFESGWRVEALGVVLADARAARAAFQGLAAETFETGWTKNPSL